MVGLAWMELDPPLTLDERRVLGVLMRLDLAPADKTVERIAAELGAERQQTWRVLRGLERRRPQLAHPDVDEGLGIQFWRTTYFAAEAMEEEDRL